MLKNLQKITVEFVKHVGREKKMPETIINEAGGKIFTYGSYRLGVFGPGELALFAFIDEAGILRITRIRH